jgi:hypothetical protein
VKENTSEDKIQLPTEIQKGQLKNGPISFIGCCIHNFIHSFIQGGGGVGGVIPPEDKLLENEEFVSDF